MEATPSERDRFSKFYHGQMDGTNKPMVDKASQRPDKTMASAISAKLRGEAPPAEKADQPEAPSGVDSDVWALAQESAHDPTSPDYDLASALLVVAQQLADLKGTQL